MKRKFFVNQLVVLVVFFVVLFVVAVFRFPGLYADLRAAFSHLRWFVLVFAFLAIFFHFFMEPARWYFYLARTEHSGIVQYNKLLCIFSVTALVTYMFPAKLGLPVRLYLLTSQARITLTKVSALMAIDGLLAYSLWGGPALCLLPFYGIATSRSFLVLLSLVMIVVLFAYLVREKLQRHLRGLQENIHLFRGRVLYFAIVFLLLDIGSYIIRHALILSAVNVEISFYKIAAITIISIFAGFISMLPMGLGAYDGTIILLLTQVGVTHEIAILVPLLNRLGNITASIALGLPASYALGVSFLTLREKAEAEKS